MSGQTGSTESEQEAGAFFERDYSVQPPAYTPGYRSTILRSPRQKLLSIGNWHSEITGPMFGHDVIGDLDHDLIHNFAQPGESAQGERALVHGRVLDERGLPIEGVLVEFWQANAGGRYRHLKDTYLAPLDPQFGGCGRCLTGDDGAYRFFTVRPGPYPWPNGDGNWWRPAHIHFSVFGTGFAQRLITQMYFEGDPLIPQCPIANTISDKAAVDRLVARLDMDASAPFDYLAYKFDIILRGRHSTLFENKLEGN